MNRPILLPAMAACLAFAPAARALDILSESERAEMERVKKLQAKPVLSCEPREFTLQARRGETASFTLDIANAGGQVLRWSFSRLPAWLAPDAEAGELKYEGRRSVVFHVRTGLMPSNSEQADIQVDAPGAEGSPVTLSVNVRLEAAERRDAGKPAPAATAEKTAGPATEPLIEPERPAAGRPRGGIGLRVGFMLPGTGPASDYSSSPFLGVQYRLPGGSGSKMSYEVGLELTSSEAEKVDSTSQLMTGRADVLFHIGGRQKGLYLLSGLGGLFESSDVSGQGKTGLLDLGAGAALLGGRLDVRLTHAVLLGGDNVSGMTLVSTAYHF